MKEKHNIEFDILRDEGNLYAEKMGLRFALPDYLREVYLTFPVDLPRLNGDDSWTLAMPARYVVGKNGTIVAADYDPDYRYRPEPEETVEALREIA